MRRNDGAVGDIQQTPVQQRIAGGHHHAPAQPAADMQHRLALADGCRNGIQLAALQRHPPAKTVQPVRQRKRRLCRNEVTVHDKSEEEFIAPAFAGDPFLPQRFKHNRSDFRSGGGPGLHFRFHAGLPFPVDGAVHQNGAAVACHGVFRDHKVPEQLDAPVLGHGARRHRNEDHLRQQPAQRLQGGCGYIGQGPAAVRFRREKSRRVLRHAERRRGVDQRAVKITGIDHGASPFSGLIKPQQE
ncbi:hypothetical protein D3C81_1398370 [compost metagenome]